MSTTLSGLLVRKREAVSREIISGWKDIASYLGKGLRTVQRYERRSGLPVRRPSGKSTGSVIATKAELDAWIAVSPLRNSLRLSQAAVDGNAALNEFRQNMKDMSRLQVQTTELGKAVSTALELLQTSVSFCCDRTQVVGGASMTGKYPNVRPRKIESIDFLPSVTKPGANSKSTPTGSCRNQDFRNQSSGSR